jgi:hypothetical protein
MNTRACAVEAIASEGRCPHQHRQRILDRLGLALGVRDLVVAALERGALTAQQPVDDLDGLCEPVDAGAGRREGDAVGVVLVALPAGAHTERELAPAHVVGGDRHVGDDGGMSVGVAVDEGADPHPGDGGRQRRH